MCDPYDCDQSQHTTFCFYLIDFQLNTDFLPILRYYRKITIALLKDQFLKKMLLKRAKIGAFFYGRTIGSNNSFTLIENNFWFLR